MHKWIDDVTFIRMRSATAGTPEFRRQVAQGRYRMLCPEIAVPADQYEYRPPWERNAIRAYAVGLGARTAVLVGKSAARLHGIPVLGWNEPVELALPGKGHCPSRKQWPEGVVYRSTGIPTAHSTELHGVRVTRIIRTAVDLSRYHGVIDGIVAFDHILAMPG